MLPFHVGPKGALFSSSYTQPELVYFIPLQFKLNVHHFHQKSVCGLQTLFWWKWWIMVGIVIPILLYYSAEAILTGHHVTKLTVIIIS